MKVQARAPNRGGAGAPGTAGARAGGPAEEAAPAPVTVLIVDDHELVRLGLRSVLEAAGEVQVVDEAATGERAVALATRLHPRVVLLDLDLPDMSGVEVCRQIHQHLPGTSVIALWSGEDDTAHADQVLLSVIRAGADGCISKRTGTGKIREAVRTVAAGGAFLDSDVARRVLKLLREGPSGETPATESAALAGLAALTPHELRILRFIATGMTNREIAERLSLAEKTVRNYVSGILHKLGLNNRAAAAAFAVRSGLSGGEPL
ncbi:MAG TPA: response regulator transcription factor [Firmicutes bacterium]|nr:response regulator transcription factor [Bacillota bacterium]